MGFTGDESQRVSILDAIGQMNWVTGTESSRPHTWAGKQHAPSREPLSATATTGCAESALPNSPEVAG